MSDVQPPATRTPSFAVVVELAAQRTVTAVKLRRDGAWPIARANRRVEKRAKTIFSPFTLHFRPFFAAAGWSKMQVLQHSSHFVGAQRQ